MSNGIRRTRGRGDPTWYKDAVFYELRVRTFFDANADGIGDLRGLIEKLDYLVDLGVTALWLLPFYPSPLRDDGYDIADYMSVHRAIGGLNDFRALIRAAHARELRIVTELVLNHTSDQHAWFQRARRAPPGSVERDFYVWSDTPERYRDARIIFTDFETSNWAWDPVAKAYYWHRFFSHQPDLNFDNPAVERALFDVVDFWLGLGVDGLRLDAVPYLYEREGTNSENLPETHAFLRRLRRHVDRKFPGRMLLAEANQWPEDAVAYFGDGDECHMAFHFPIMPRLFLALRTEEAFPILDILAQTPSIPADAQWAIFLRNHDELTLEMVTDDERDLMLRAYAREPEMRVNLGIRRRLAPLLGNHRRRIELLNALLFSLPGSPVLYYGDEIGMGDNVYLGDRSGVRTPMQWSPDRNAGFSSTSPQRLILPLITDSEYHYEAVNVETQERNPSSLLWWMKRLVAMRKRHPAFARGNFEPVPSGHRSILAFLRRTDAETLLVVANLSRFVQRAELALSDWVGFEPVELFGGARFPALGRGTYPMSVGPHEFFWFALQPARNAAPAPSESVVPEFRVRQRWTELLEVKRRPSTFDGALSLWLQGRRWYRGRSRSLERVKVTASVECPAGRDARLVFLGACYPSEECETYVTALGLRRDSEDLAIARVKRPERRHARSVIDVSHEPFFAEWLFSLVRSKRRLSTPLGLVVAERSPALTGTRYEGLSALPIDGEQTNSSYFLGEHAVLKLMRRLEEGTSVELEVLSALAPNAHQLGIPRLLGSLALMAESGPSTLAIVTGRVQSQGSLWQATLEEILRFFDRELTERGNRRKRRAEAAVGGYLEVARRVGERLAALHVALAEHPSLGSERFSQLARRAAYQSQRRLAQRCFEALRSAKETATEPARSLTALLMKQRRAIDSLLRSVEKMPDWGRAIRVHGDLHLGQILHTGSDFVFIDFEGEPGRSLEERRRRRSPLVDVAGVLRSFSYAMHGVLWGDALVRGPRREDAARLGPAATDWLRVTSNAFLDAYEQRIMRHDLVPGDRTARRALLRAFTLEKALYEVQYELDHRPEWVSIPLRGLLEVLGSQPLFE